MKNNIYSEVAQRVALRESKEGELAIAFYRTYTGPNVSTEIEDHMISIPVRKRALGELLILLKQKIEKDMEGYGFKIAN